MGITTSITTNCHGILSLFQRLYNTDTDVWEDDIVLVSGVPNNGSAEVTVPDYEQLDETTVRVADFKVSLSTITNPVKRFIVPAIRSVGRFIVRHAIRLIKKRIKAEITGKQTLIEFAIRVACEVWHKTDGGINTASLPPCPCNTTQARGDDRFKKENFLQLLVNKLGFKKSKANSCYRQANVG